jgi:copper resistance protein B
VTAARLLAVAVVVVAWPSVPSAQDAHAGHAPHGERIQWLVLADQLEWRSGRGGGLAWDAKGWIGGDRARFWFRTEGERDGGRLADGHAHLLYGRAVSPWWEVVAGVRQDLRPGPAQTWLAVGIQGLAPYWLDVEATAYAGARGRTQLRLEVGHALLVTNRAVLQPIVEIDAFGTDDFERGIGRGLSSIETGLRLRYEIRRELAPYVGVTWRRTFFGTRDLARAAGDPVSAARLTAGVRVWR